MGVAELLAQRMTVAWWHGTVLTQRKIIVPPRFVENGKASTLYRAVDSGCGQLDVKGIAKLCEAVPWVFLAENPDNAKPNRRKMWATNARLPKNCLYVPTGCCVHSCYRIVEAATPKYGKLTLSGDLYALVYVCHIYSHVNQLYKALTDIVEREVDILYEWEVTDQQREEWETYGRAVLEHTVMRHTLHTRARLEGGDDAFKLGVRELASRESMEKLLSLCNGDLTSPRVTHICRGRSCCTSRSETAEKIVAALMENNFLLSKGGLPSESRWGSVSNTNSLAAFGLMFHGLLQRVWKRAYPSWESGSAVLDLLEEVPQNNNEDFHLTLRRKVYRVHKFLTERGERACIMSVVAEPLDWLWHRLQYLDETGSSLLDIGSPDRNPFRQSQVQLASLLSLPFDQTAMAVLWLRCPGTRDRNADTRPAPLAPTSPSRVPSGPGIGGRVSLDFTL